MLLWFWRGWGDKRFRSETKSQLRCRKCHVSQHRELFCLLWIDHLRSERHFRPGTSASNQLTACRNSNSPQRAVDDAELKRETGRKPCKYVNMNTHSEKDNQTINYIFSPFTLQPGCAGPAYSCFTAGPNKIRGTSPMDPLPHLPHPHNTRQYTDIPLQKKSLAADPS